MPLISSPLLSPKTSNSHWDFKLELRDSKAFFNSLKPLRSICEPPIAPKLMSFFGVLIRRVFRANSLLIGRYRRVSIGLGRLIIGLFLKSVESLAQDVIH